MKLYFAPCIRSLLSKNTNWPQTRSIGKKKFTVLDPRGLTVCRLFSVESPRDLVPVELQTLIQTIEQYQITNHTQLLEELKILILDEKN